MSEGIITISVRTSRRTEFVEITDAVAREAARAGAGARAALIYVPHTTAGVTINENADPAVAEDIIRCLERLVPRDGPYVHAEGNADAHVKACLVGSSARVIIREGRLCLGRWQGIFLCEFDGPRRREVWLSFDIDEGRRE